MLTDHAITHAKTMFYSGTRNHVLTIVRDDGESLYRHLRGKAPGTSNNWFEIITWPGSLVIRGDHGGHIFSRRDDMFAFFRSNGNEQGINPSYWAEKTPDYGRSVQVYDPDTLRDLVNTAITEYETDEYPDLLAQYQTNLDAYHQLSASDQRDRGEPERPLTPAELRAIVDEYDSHGELEEEDGARRLLRDLEKQRVISDSWEWDLQTWDHHFLWCLYAIVWAIGHYDAIITGTTPPPRPQPDDTPASPAAAPPAPTLRPIETVTLPDVTS